MFQSLSADCAAVITWYLDSVALSRLLACGNPAFLHLLQRAIRSVQIVYDPDRAAKFPAFVRALPHLDSLVLRTFDGNQTIYGIKTSDLPSTIRSINLDCRNGLTHFTRPISSVGPTLVGSNHKLELLDLRTMLPRLESFTARIGAGEDGINRKFEFRPLTSH